MPIIDTRRMIRAAVNACCLLGLSGAAMAATLANPAAVLCVKNGATLTVETAENGAQRGICVFADGTRIDEWAYFRNKHRNAGLSPLPPPDAAATPKP